MQLSYEITLPEWKSALKLHSRQTLGRRIHWFIYDYVIPGVTLAFLAITLAMYLAGGAPAISPLAITDVILVAMTILLVFVRRSRVRAMFRTLVPPTAKSRTKSLVLSDEQIVSSMEGIGETRYLWSGILKFVQNGIVALFYITDEQFLLIPLRVLSSEERAELDGLVGRHVVNR
jgi:hypothetical protein